MERGPAAPAPPLRTHTQGVTSDEALLQANLAFVLFCKHQKREKKGGEVSIIERLQVIRVLSLKALVSQGLRKEERSYLS